MTFLSAFQSECGRKGRVWTKGSTFYRRTIDDRMEYMPHGHNEWKTLDRQIVTMEGTVTWADEPKTLTPQEALRALADGKCVTLGGRLYRATGVGLQFFTSDNVWADSVFSGDFRIVPDPSQPAEPAKTPLKVGDRVKRGPDWKWPNDARRGGVVDEVDMDAEEVWVKWDSGFASGHRYGAEGKYDIEKIEAEPQVEYPLTYAEALVALHDDETIAVESDPELHMRLDDGELQSLKRSEDDDLWLKCDMVATDMEKAAKWRIVDGGK